ncbi:MAG TPA: PIN domain-containing protein [Polyangiaceae bacterium]
MKSVFVDTSAFYALSDAGESTHVVARTTLAGLEKAGVALVTTTDIVDEIVTLVRYRLGHAPAVILGARLAASRWCRVVDVTDEIRTAAWQLFVSYEDQKFSLTDCTSFATMRAMDIDEAFGFDHTDFLAAGFSVIPDATEIPRRRTRR